MPSKYARPKIAMLWPASRQRIAKSRGSFFRHRIAGLNVSGNRQQLHALVSVRHRCGPVRKALPATRLNDALSAGGDRSERCTVGPKELKLSDALSVNH